MLKQIRQHKYFPIALFLVLYATFYFGHKFYTGLTVPHGLYVPFLDEYLNYVRWFRRVLLEGAAFFIRLFGHDTQVHATGVRMESGRGVKLIYACLGFSILSFWWAMILAFPQSLKNKLIFWFGGTLFIIALNMVRIAGVALVFNSAWGAAHRQIDHHLIFNLVVYGILFLMLIKWFNLKERRDISNTQRV